MGSGPRHKVQTRYGWFSLDEGSYRDYLAGKLTWIDWPPKRTERATEQPSLPPDASKEAVQLRDKAEMQGLLPVLQQFKTAPSPYKQRMANTHIFEISLAVRASNGLMRAGIDTFEKLDVLIRSPGGVCTIRNLGIKSAKEIQDTFFVECYCKLLPYEKADYWQSVLDTNKREHHEP